MSITTAKEISKRSNSSFYYAFNLLPSQKRDAMNAVYAFCRETDDIVDEGKESLDVKYQLLHRWRNELEFACEGKSSYALLNTVGSTIKKFNIPIEHFFELIKGVETDLLQNRFSTFEELREYCYRVASTVGLMCIEIFGYKHETTKQFAVNLGIALQLTNIIRDVKKDAEKGRIYLPIEDLKLFNYSEEELFNKVYNENFVALMDFQTKRAISYFDKSNQYLNPEDKISMFAARAMQHIYRRMLDKLIKANYDVYSKNIKVTKFEKVGISLGVWVKYNLVYR